MLVNWTPEEVNLLRRRFENLDEITSFSANPKLCAKIAAHGMQREVGTNNDELARFIFNAATSAPVTPASLKAEIIEWKNLAGVRVYSSETDRLELRTPGFFDMVHPRLSKDEDGTYHSLLIFPEIINEIARAQGVELTVVKSWGLNSIFGGFDPAKGYYQTNMWELENNDALKFAGLIKERKLAFMGTHDLIAHIAGIDGAHWPELQKNATRVYQAIGDYFRSVRKPNIAALVLPYTIGVVLDDLAQPPSYSSESHVNVLNELLLKLEAREIKADQPTHLREFPKSFEKIIRLSRKNPKLQKASELRATIDALVNEIKDASLAG